MTAKPKPHGNDKYKPAHCDEVIKFLAKGHSVAAFAGHISVHRDTVYEWAKQHKEFDGALKIGIGKAVGFWETKLIELAETGKGNASAAIFGLKNRASQDWSDRVVNEHMGKDGGPVLFKTVYETA